MITDFELPLSRQYDLAFCCPVPLPYLGTPDAGDPSFPEGRLGPTRELSPCSPPPPPFGRFFFYCAVLARVALPLSRPLLAFSLRRHGGHLAICAFFQRQIGDFLLCFLPRFGSVSQRCVLWVSSPQKKWYTSDLFLLSRFAGFMSFPMVWETPGRYARRYADNRTFFLRA